MYRLDIDYYSRDYDDRACCTSEPIYTLEDGRKKYSAAILETCIDDRSRPARAWLWKYRNIRGQFAPVTIAKNY